MREQVQDARIVGFLSHRSKPSQRNQRASDAYSESIESGGFEHGCVTLLASILRACRVRSCAQESRSTAGSTSPPVRAGRNSKYVGAAEKRCQSSGLIIELETPGDSRSLFRLQARQQGRRRKADRRSSSPSCRRNSRSDHTAATICDELRARLGGCFSMSAAQPLRHGKPAISTDIGARSAHFIARWDPAVPAQSLLGPLSPVGF